MPAPDLEEIAKETTINKKLKVKLPKKKEKKMPQKKKSDVPLLKAVLPFKVYGLGGAGRIAANRYATRYPNTDVITIDTTNGLTRTVAGVDCIHIPNLNGSGKLRSTNIEHIQNEIANYISHCSFADMNIIICSLAGGSGSVIGPLLAKEILRDKKQCIFVSIVDVGSEVDINNCLNTLRSIEAVAKKGKAYLPCSLFNNAHGRKVVDNGIDVTLDKLTTILSEQFYELDKMDRVNFFNPSNLLDYISPGVRLLNVTNQESGAWDQNLGLVIPEDVLQKLDAALIISSIEDDLDIKEKTSVIYRGYFDNDSETTDLIVASLGYAIPKNFITDLSEQIHQFRSVSDNHSTDIEVDEEYDTAEELPSGLFI